MEGCTGGKVYFLGLITVSYIIGEIAHFLINTTSREVARELHYGDQACYRNATARPAAAYTSFDCPGLKEEAECRDHEECTWDYSGLGIDYQVSKNKPKMVSGPEGLNQVILYKSQRHEESLKIFEKV